MRTGSKTENEFIRSMFSLPTSLQWNNYYLALIRSKILFFFNTIFNGVTSVAVIVFFSFCIGYFLARYDFRGKSLVNSLLMLAWWCPCTPS